jgi:hypothetical protein
VATQDDVRRIALALPDTVEAKDRFAFSVRNKDKEKGFVWVWLERLDPKQARVPNPKLVAIRVPDDGEKQALLATNSKKFFTDDHYNGFPAVLVRLAAIRARELEQLITDAWRTMAPKALAKQFDEEERS